MTSGDVVVIGAGPAGLAAAWQVARRGGRVVVVERSGEVGGLAGSFDVGGLPVDHGSHRLHPSIDARILHDLRGLLGEGLQVRPRHGRIRLEGRWVAFPLRAADLVRRLPLSFVLRAGRDAVSAPFRRPRTDSFHEVVRAGLGPTMAQSFYGPYVRKLWGVDPRELSGELARRRVSARTPSDLARRLTGAARGRGRTFLYPQRGFGQICVRMAEAATGAGADILLGTEVTSLRLDDSPVVILGDGTEVEAGRVWSTMPLPALAQIAEPEAPGEVHAAAERLEHRAMALVYLVLERARYSPFDAHYFPGAHNPVSRLSEPKNYRDGPDPPDRTVLCAEVPCTVGDEIWRASPAELGGRVADALAVDELPPTDHVEVEVRRVARVYPVYRLGFERDLGAVERWAGSHPALLTFGRQGLFAPDNTHHALAMGWAAADALHPDGTFDREAWRRARDGFREHVVED